MIRVGKRIYNNDGSYTDPTYPNYTAIITTRFTEYGELGSNCLKDDDGRIMENIYRFSQLYEEVPEVKIRASNHSNKIIWSHPKETHINKGEITSEYWEWRKKGMSCSSPVKYPCGFCGNIMTVCLLKENDDKTVTTPLGYIDGRKQVYVPLYCKLVKKNNKFEELKKRLSSGENLLIIETDGPHQESLKYYKDMYKVDDNFIEKSTILVNKENIQIMLNDPKHPFGYGYCLAMALLDKDKEWNSGEPKNKLLLEHTFKNINTHINLMKNVGGYSLYIKGNDLSTSEFYQIQCKYMEKICLEKIVCFPVEKIGKIYWKIITELDKSFKKTGKYILCCSGKCQLLVFENPIYVNNNTDPRRLRSFDIKTRKIDDIKDIIPHASKNKDMDDKIYEKDNDKIIDKTFL